MYPKYLKVGGQLYSRYPQECKEPDENLVVDVYKFLHVTPPNIHNLPGRLLFCVDYTDTELSVEAKSVLSYPSNINDGDFFVLTDKNGKRFTMVIEKAYNEIDCISLDLLKPTIIRSLTSSLDNKGGYCANVDLINYLNDYYNTRFPPVLKPYVINKNVKVPVKEPGRTDATLKTESLGPLWIPYSTEVGFLGFDSAAGCVDDLKIYYITGSSIEHPKTYDNIVARWWTCTPAPIDRCFLCVTPSGMSCDNANIKNCVPLCFRLQYFG